jgi:regulator of nucleoside diphosphate kinase
MDRRILITDDDALNLREMIDRAHFERNGDGQNAANLEGELRRAKIVPQEQVPGDVVTMNSKVRLRDLDTRECELYRLVYPWNANVDNNRISVLAPVGTAIIGCRVGDVVEWPVPVGVRRLRIEELIYQPEREGVHSFGHEFN